MSEVEAMVARLHALSTMLLPAEAPLGEQWNVPNEAADLLAAQAAELAKRDEWMLHWQTKCQATNDLLQEATARALAAEAALAKAFDEGLEAAAQFLEACDDYGDRHKATEIRALAKAKGLGEEPAGLTEVDKRMQGSRCSCRGVDDYGPCQNVPDAETQSICKASTAQ